MAYIAAADLRERTQKPFASNVVLTEGDIIDAQLDLIIAQVVTGVELDLADDFEPPNPDNDETIDVDGWGGTRLFLPRRVRSITSVAVRAPFETAFTTQASTAYRLRKSLNSAGTAMLEGRSSDWLDALPGLSYGAWPLGAETVRLVGKFGWAAVPEDIKRLVALRVYDIVKTKQDPLNRISQRITLDATIVYGPSQEMDDIVTRYRRSAALAYIG